jgi:hypothetical protein
MKIVANITLLGFWRFSLFFVLELGKREFTIPKIFSTVNVARHIL